jgi:hypothetical protein
LEFHKELFKTKRNEQTKRTMVQFISTFLDSSICWFIVIVSNIPTHNNIGVFRGYTSVFWLRFKGNNF